MNRIAWQVVVWVMAVVLLPTSGAAQPPATSFDDLRHVLVPGQEVLVAWADGRRTRETVFAVTAASLDVQSKSVFRFRGPGPRMSLTESSVSSVKRVDSVWQGALIGYAAGFGLGVAGCRANERECVPIAAVLLPTLLGGLVGASIDAAIRQTVYLNGTPRAGRRAVVTLSPVINMTATGAAMTLRF
jgi:hypothetical protein